MRDRLTRMAGGIAVRGSSPAATFFNVLCALPS
jgi:hypothetical protein